MSQPPLSQAIRKLEGDLGVRLFKRTSRAVAPTEAGRVFAEEARRVIAQLDHAVAEAREAAGSVPALRIGCSPYVRIELLQSFWRHSSFTTRNCLFRQRTSSRWSRCPSSARAKLDLGIFPAAHEEPDLETEPLFAGEPLDLLVPPEHPLASREAIGPDDVRDEVLLIIPRAPNPAFTTASEHTSRPTATTSVRSSKQNSMTVREVLFGVADGRGVAFVPELAELSESGTIVSRLPLDPPFAMPDTVVAWRRDLTADAHPMLDLVRDVARELRAHDREKTLTRRNAA